jgi:choline-glycine betaine transporter
VPLSEHEQRLLEQIERALYAEDPKFASTVSSTNLRTHARRRIVWSVVGFIVGIGALLTGVVVQSVPLAVIGFLVMFATAVYAFSQSKRLFGRPDLRVVGGNTGTPNQRSRKPHRGGLLRRMEERFRRRFDDQ